MSSWQTSSAGYNGCSPSSWAVQAYSYVAIQCSSLYISTAFLLAQQVLYKFWHFYQKFYFKLTNHHHSIYQYPHEGVSL
jgi:hypothetical protein